jgi:hypothetical protein
MLPAMSAGGISVLEGAIMTGVEFGIGGFGAGLASGFAGGMSAGDAFKNAGYGFASGFIIGGIVGATYTAGWQDIFHGVDTQKINNLYNQAKDALKTGNFQGYATTASQLKGMKATPPGAVLQGKSPIPGGLGAKHSYLVAAKDAQVKTMGFDAIPEMKTAAISMRIAVLGVVRAESAATLASSTFNVLSWDLARVTSVWGNMDKIRFPIYELASPERNCYGWTNAVLKESGLSPIDARDVW